MENSSSSNLLSKARAFACKSALLVIAPLAAVQVAHATDTVFELPTSLSGGYNASFPFSGGYFTRFDLASASLPSQFGIQGVKLSEDATFVFNGSDTGTASLTFTPPWDPVVTTGASIASGVDLQFTYNFHLSYPTSNISVTGWNLSFSLDDGTHFASDTIGAYSGAPLSAGDISGSFTYTTGSSFNVGTTYSLSLDFTVTGADIGDGFSVDMTGLGQGVFLNAIPEPSTYALLFGGVALGLAWVRRRFKAVV